MTKEIMDLFAASTGAPQNLGIVTTSISADAFDNLVGKNRNSLSWVNVHISDKDVDNEGMLRELVITFLKARNPAYLDIQSKFGDSVLRPSLASYTPFVLQGVGSGLLEVIFFIGNSTRFLHSSGTLYQLKYIRGFRHQFI